MKIQAHSWARRLIGRSRRYAVPIVATRQRLATLRLRHRSGTVRERPTASSAAHQHETPAPRPPPFPDSGRTPRDGRLSVTIAVLHAFAGNVAAQDRFP